MKCYFVYILANITNQVLYIGVTSSIERRLSEHSIKSNSFAQKYRVNKLVHAEEFSDINDAIRREKQLKNWHREWKMNLIRETNPEFKDLFR